MDETIETIETMNGINYNFAIGKRSVLSFSCSNADLSIPFMVVSQ